MVSGDWVTHYKSVLVNRIRLHRSLAQMKQSDLAKKVKMSQSTLAKIEMGQTLPSLNNLIKIAEALEIKPHVFLVPVPMGAIRGDLIINDCSE